MSDDRYEESVTRLVNVCRDVFGSTFKAYYNGDPEGIPLFNLPALIVDQTGDTTTGEGAAGEDDVTDRIIMKVVLNKRDDYTGDKVDPLNTTNYKIRQLIGRRDPDTGKYAENTLKHVVRTLALDGIEAVDGDMTVEYGIVPRGGSAEYASLTSEGHLTFSIQYSVDTF